MPELVLYTATGILWYPAKTIKCWRAWVAQQQSHTLPREDKIKHILSRIESCARLYRTVHE